MTDESSLEERLEMLFERIPRKQFSFDLMAKIANTDKAFIVEPDAIPFSTFCKAADCLMKTCIEVDIRVCENYLNVMKRLFFMISDFNEAMHYVYTLDFFRESPGGVPELRAYYKTFDVEMTRIVNSLTEVNTFAVNSNVENLTRSLAFLLLIAPKPAIRQLLVFMIQTKPLWPSVLMMLDRIPAFFKLRIPTLKSKPKECSDILIIMFFRRLLNVERDVIDMTSAADRETLQALILAFTRTQFGAGAESCRVITKHPLVGATDLLREFIMHYLAESMHVDFFLSVLTRMFRVDADRQWMIRWATDDVVVTADAVETDVNEIGSELIGEDTAESEVETDGNDKADVNNEVEAHDEVDDSTVEKSDDNESKDDANEAEPTVDTKDGEESLIDTKDDDEQPVEIKTGENDNSTTADDIAGKAVENNSSAVKVEPFALLSLLIEKHAESEEGSETRNLIPIVLKALASKFAVDGVLLSSKNGLVLEKLAPFDWSLRFCVCRWLKQSISSSAMGSKIPIPNVLYEALASDCRTCYSPIASTLDCSETENFIRCIFELALTSTSEALDFVNKHKFGLLPTRVYSPMIADALLRSIRVKTSVNTLLKLRPVIEALFALLDVPVKQRCGNYHTERMFDGMRKLAPVLVLFEALFIYIKDNQTGNVEALDANDLSHDARILLDTFTQSAIIHVNETYLKLKTTTVVFKTEEFGSHSESELVAALSEIGLLFTNIAYLAERLQPIPTPLKSLKAELSQLARQLYNKVYPPYADDICRYIRPTSCSSLRLGATGSTSAGESDVRSSAGNPKPVNAATNGKPITNVGPFDKEWRKKRGGNGRRSPRCQPNSGGGGGEKFGTGSGGGGKHHKKRRQRSREAAQNPTAGHSAAAPRSGSRHHSNGGGGSRRDAPPEDGATGAFLAT